MNPPTERLLTEKEQQNVIAVLMAGGNLRTAADYVGLPRTWIQATADADEEFRKRIDHADPHFELAQLGNITKAALREQYWRAAAWMLERRFPTRYGKRTPEALTAAKVKTLLEGLASIVCLEVTDEEVRGRILNQLQQLLARIKTGAKEP